MGSELRIYFAASVRGGADFAFMRRRIGALESLGAVLTRHLGSPRTVELGGRSDADIYREDQRLLEEADVFIADFSTPSTGSGFMAARAVQAKKPTLALFSEGQRASAMITGCPELETRFFTDEASFDQQVRAFFLSNHAQFSHLKFRAPKVFLAGPPGSGKGTLGAALSRVTGAPHISTGELLRELVARDPLAKVGEYMKAGQLVPAELMRDLVLERLRQPDCRLFGFILDGYPPSREDLANLISGGITPDLVCYLDCGDGTAVQRQVKRAARSTDTTGKATERLAVFHRAEVSFEALANTWYPESIVMRVDAEQPAAVVEATVLQTVEHLFGDPRRDHSFFTVAAFRPGVSGSRFHFHVDAPGAERVAAISRRIHARHKAAQGRVKQYPIASLHLGPQVAQLPIYAQLPNFHAFDDAPDEAFLTGALGDGDDALMKVVLEETRASGGMAEIEEELGEWTLQADGTVQVPRQARDERVAARDERVAARDEARFAARDERVAARDEARFATRDEARFATRDEARFAEFDGARCSDIPSLELHLGFDLPKRDGEGLPLPLATLMAECSKRGLINGGWFLFRKTDHWAYRSNEFSSESPTLAEPRLTAQAHALRQVLQAAGISCAISFSLERVHGIWTF